MRETLVHPKDKLDKSEQVGHVYHIPCAGANLTPCPGTYIGETQRTAAARFQEHTSTATNALGKYKSAMLQHAKDHNHHFRKDDITILTSDHNWIKRGIKEAIHIHTLKPSINIDPGRHQLSNHFDHILRDTIKAPPAPAPHNPTTETLINTAPRRQGRPRREPTQNHISHQHQGHTSQQQQPSQEPHDSQQQPNRTTHPKTFIQAESQPQRQSQRLLARQQQQQQQQLQQTAGMRSSDGPPAAP